MESRTRVGAAWVTSILGAAAIGALACGRPPGQTHGLRTADTRLQFPNVEIADLSVPVPRIPADPDQPTANLNLREFRRADAAASNPVLMIHGASVPGVAWFDLRTGDHYDLALWLAEVGGFDVFVLDFQGSGPSEHPAPMSDPCNVPIADQERALIGNPLPATCKPSYPYQLVTSGSDWTELDIAVEFVRARSGAQKVKLVAWSQGSFRVGPYSVHHRDKVDSLLLLAPIYNPDFRSGIDAAGPDGTPLKQWSPPVPVPAAGTPMSIRTRADLMGLWDAEGSCADQREPGIQDAVWDAIMENDALGKTWGPPEGLVRVRTPTLWGWNAAMAAEVTVPVMIVQGQFDKGTGALQKLAQLYDTIQSTNKLRFRVACAGHFVLWEAQRRIVHRIATDWLKHGSVRGFETGEFLVDTDGNLSPCERVFTSDGLTSACAGEP